MTNLAPIGLLAYIASIGPLLAQGPAFDTSGNGLLSGTYYFRHVLYGINTAADSSGFTGDITEAIASFGTISFDGKGGYTIANATAIDSISGASSLSGQIGTYSISASGFGFILNPITQDKVFGLVSANGVFVGSSTETTQSYNDLFIAALATPSLANSFFQGSYSVAGFFPGGSPLTTEDAFFQMNPNGAGNLGTVNVSGYSGRGGTSAVSQSSNATYSFTNGAAVVNFPTSTTANFFSGQEYLYFSPDGSFFFGGSPNGFDMLAGVQNASGTQNLSGLYYSAGLDQDDSSLSTGVANLDGYYGAFNATASGTILVHQRVNSVSNSGAFGSTFEDTFRLPVAGTYTDTPGYEQYAVGAGGAVRIGQGIYPYLGITVGLQAPAFSGSGVYLNPAGVVNAASFSPFTAGVSNGEFLTLYGSNLSLGAATATKVPFPTTLNGVQVMVNGVAAPIYYVTPGQLAIVMPAGNTFPVAQFQVFNNGSASNIVTELVNPTTPGVFTANLNGLGYAAVEHVNGAVVSPASPAQPGETVEVFVSGLGTVFPVVPDGSPAPLSPLSMTSQTITAAVGGTAATVNFAGLAPDLVGLYQVNVTIPSNAAAGDQALDISGPDSYNSQALISIGTGLSASGRQPSASGHRHIPRSGLAMPRLRPCFFPAKTACGAL